MPKIIVRATGIYIANNKLLMLKQANHGDRHYSLPGGKVEPNEQLGDCLVREMKEETGLDVIPQRLLYVCDNIKNGKHVLHISFQVKKTGGSFSERLINHDSIPIEAVEMLPLTKLENYGLTNKFAELVRNNFPGAGSYMGMKNNIGL